MAFNVLQFSLGQFSHLVAGMLWIFAHFKKPGDFFQREIHCLGALYEPQPRQVSFIINADTGRGTANRAQQLYLLVVTQRIGGQARQPGHVTDAVPGSLTALLLLPLP